MRNTTGMAIATARLTPANKASMLRTLVAIRRLPEYNYGDAMIRTAIEIRELPEARR